MQSEISNVNSAHEIVKKKVGAGVILISFANHILEFLCVQAATGIWSFPKGHPNENESLIDCALRECVEEASLQLHDFKSKHKRWIKILNQIYFIDVIEDETITKSMDFHPKDKHEIQVCKWCTLEFLLTQDLNWALQQVVKVFVEDNFVTKLLFNPEHYTQEQRQFLPQKDSTKVYISPIRLCYFWHDADVCCVHDDCPTTREQYERCKEEGTLHTLYVNQLPLHSSPTGPFSSTSSSTATKRLSPKGSPKVSPKGSPKLVIKDNGDNTPEFELTQSTFKYSVCRHWIRQGTCDYGDKCMFYHPTRKVCKFVLNGEPCKYGSKCLFLHDNK